MLLVLYTFICRKKRASKKVKNGSATGTGPASFGAILDQYSTFKEVTEALRQAGLESSNLIFAIDFTMSNMQQGRKTFGGRSLHMIEDGLFNPYQVRAAWNVW